MKVAKYIKSIRYKNTSFRIYLLCVVLRIILVFAPQTGYIHPDEFFQSVEVFLGEQFDIEHERTWEFNITFPIRSVVVPYFTLKIPLNFLHFLHFYVRYYAGIDLLNSYVYLVFPRLIMCILSFFNDISLYSICRLYSLKYETRLLALGSSFVMLVFGSRTFSNTVEMTLCSVLLYFVSDCMIHSNTIIYKLEVLNIKYQNATTTSDRVKFYKERIALPAHSLNRVVLISTLSVIGVFNRPTFLVFGAPMVFFWLLRGMGTKTVSFVDFNLRISLFVFCAVPTIVLFTVIDSLYYGYLTSGEIRMMDIGIDNFVFTPWNFVKYNIDSSKTALHGVHPRYLHLLINIPLLYNILGVVAIFSFGQLVCRFLSGDYRNLPRSQSIIGLMTSAIFVPLVFMSYINHQEARFLIPMTLPIVLLHGHKLDGISFPNPFSENRPILAALHEKFIPRRITRKVMLRIWCTANLVLLLFYGFFHQGGVYQLSAHFSNIMKAKSPAVNVHLITSHIYSLPVAFVNTPNSQTIHTDRGTRKKYRRSKQFYVHEMGGMDITRILSAVSNIANRYEPNSTKKQTRRYKIYVAMPSSLSDEFNQMFRSNMSDMEFQYDRRFYPHLSTEALPNPLQRYYEHDLWSVSGILRISFDFLKQFGLALYIYET